MRGLIHGIERNLSSFINSLKQSLQTLYSKSESLLLL